MTTVLSADWIYIAVAVAARQQIERRTKQLVVVVECNILVSGCVSDRFGGIRSATPPGEKCCLIFIIIEC